MSSKLEQLLQKLCPNGVPFTPLSDITSILRGRRLTKKQLHTDGQYPVFHGGIEPLGHYAEYNREAQTVMIINVGASAGTVGIYPKPYWASDGCFCINPSPAFNNRYLFHFFKSIEPFLVSKVRHAGIPTLDIHVIESVRIPVPPIEIQNEIVSILDKLSELTAELTTELTAELTARQKQYEYYRDQLLDFENRGGITHLQ
ncbi:MAG: restriction endonuclease subunit S [Akkermansia sp.]|nr:restriction endonuclease subunit S [Akkermansia sp.]